MIEVAHQEVPAHPEGVWFVDLAAIADDATIAGTFRDCARASRSTS